MIEEVMEQLIKLLDAISAKIDANQNRIEEVDKSANSHICSVDHYHNYNKEKLVILIETIENKLKKQDERILELEGANKPSNYETKTIPISER